MRAGVLLVGLSLGASAPLSAQLGAIGAATGAAAVSTEEGINSAPLLSESGLVLGDGWAVNAGFSLVETEVLLFDGFGGSEQATFSSTGLSVSGVFAPNPDLMLGATITPYLGVMLESPSGSSDDSGRGDASLFAKYRAWRSQDGRSSFAATGSVRLPVASDGFGQEGASVGASGAISHRLGGGSPLTLHGSLGFSVPTNEDDGVTAVNFSGAGVYRTSERFAFSGELLGASADGEYIVNLAPGARISAGQNWLVDLALAFNVGTSLEVSPFDYGFFVGGNYVP
ncbi:MAG: transporter [Gemmatimonadetes bacterium]|nr:transporter [Gemmatimonadota bacterium]